MIRRVAANLVLLGVILTACSSAPADVECRIDRRCDAAVAAAQSAVSLNGARVVVIWGRGRGFHAEVHACYPDGRTAIVDVVGEDLTASLRQHVREIPLCR